MNEIQRKILIAAAGVVALMVLFPPYIVENYRGVTLMAGYGFLFDLPSYTMQLSSSIPSSTIPASVNVKTLLVQIFGATVAGGLVFVATKR